jgi:hypothetical protein
VPCFKPRHAFRVEGGGIAFTEPAVGSLGPVTFKCGQCVGCRLARRQEWTARIMHEALLHETSSFITLTYDDEHLPLHGSLHHPDVQRFFKRVRRSGRKFRYYMCGEYGEKFSRPHYHVCMFGQDFSGDRVHFKGSADHKLYISDTLTNLWGEGFALIGDLTVESAAYVAGYTLKKVTGKASEGHYTTTSIHTGEITQMKPEYGCMSLKPGIGADWIDEFASDCFPHDFVWVRGKKVPIPRYYFDRWKALPDVDSDRIEFERYLRAAEHSADVTPERLKVREAVALAKQKSLTRTGV